MGFVRWELPIGPRCSCPLHSGSCEAAALLPSRSPRWLDPATHPNWGPHAASARSAGPFRQITPPRCQAASQLHLEGNRSLEVDMLTGHGRSTPVGTGGSVSRGRSASVGGHRSVSTGEGPSIVLTVGVGPLGVCRRAFFLAVPVHADQWGPAEQAFVSASLLIVSCRPSCPPPQVAGPDVRTARRAHAGPVWG